MAPLRLKGLIERLFRSFILNISLKQLIERKARIKGKANIMIAQKLHIGIDISKNYLDVYLYNHKDHNQNTYFRTENNAKSIALLIKKLTLFPIKNVTLEATGGYEKPLIRALHKNNFTILRPNAMNVRMFAKGCNIKAKTDKVDARILAIYGCLTGHHELIKTSPLEEDLKELTTHREILCEQRKREKTRLPKACHRLSKKIIMQNIKRLDKQIESLEKEIYALVKSSDNLKAKYRILLSIPGIGNITAFHLLSHLRELGYLDNKKIASLCGVAPFTRESGSYKGKSYIRGGRKSVRNKLYMCALTAMRIGRFKAMYNRMLKAGKPAKIALTAIMRKIIVIANSLIKKGELFKENIEANRALL